MKIRHTTSSGDAEIEMQMTPMIDIVFQLLIFFIMTFKIVVSEGDFHVKMPLAAQASDSLSELNLSMVVTLKSDQHGNLNKIIIEFPGTGEKKQSTLTLPKLEESYSKLKPDEKKMFRQDVLVAFASLRMTARNFVKGDTGTNSPEKEATIALDDQLDYMYVIDAVTHISGYFEGKKLVPLIQKINFKPPKE